MYNNYYYEYGGWERCKTEGEIADDESLELESYYNELYEEEIFCYSQYFDE